VRRIFLLLIPLLFAGCTTLPPPAPSLSAEIKAKYEMDLLRPPSTLYPPGTIATARILDRGSDRTARIVYLDGYCHPGAALPLDSIPKSTTETFSIVYNVSADASARAEVLKIVGFDVGAKGVDKIEITLKNPTLYKPDDVQLSTAVAAIKKLPECTIKGRFLVTAVLQADIDVKTTWSGSANLSASEKFTLARLMGASLGANISNETNETTSGTGVFYAIELAPPSRG